MRPVWLGVFLLACHPRPPAPVASAHVVHDQAPADAQRWYLEAVRAEVLGDLERSRRAFEWVVRLDRRSPWAHLALARSLARSSDPGARASFDAATTLFLDGYPVEGVPSDLAALVEAASGACRLEEVTAWLVARGATPPEPTGAPAGCVADGAAAP